MKVHIFETNHAPVTYCGIPRSSFRQFVTDIYHEDPNMPGVELATGKTDRLLYETRASVTYCKSCARLYNLYVMHGTQHPLLPAIQ